MGVSMGQSILPRVPVNRYYHITPWFILHDKNLSHLILSLIEIYVDLQLDTAKNLEQKVEMVVS
jgi:hypothetical protein